VAGAGKKERDLVSRECAAPMMDAREIDWGRLRRLRQSYLSHSAGRSDYWEDEKLLRDYDATFGRRIAWKWQWVLADLKRLGWNPPGSQVLDWGCGSGVAMREFAREFPVSCAGFHDRSALAVRFAAQQFQSEHSGVEIGRGGIPDVLLISHVLTEMDAAVLDGVLKEMRDVPAIVWVEPGGVAESNFLTTRREMLQAGGFHAVAPCVHNGKCGLLASPPRSDWCHHFADPPPEAFTSSFWGHFAREMGVDLRSLPLSYLVLDKRRDCVRQPPDAVRLLGRPRVQKPCALLLGCDSCGVEEKILAKRRFPDVFRKLRHGEYDSLFRWQAEGREISAIEAWRADGG
jgi:hypothetical protein